MADKKDVRSRPKPSPPRTTSKTQMRPAVANRTRAQIRQQTAFIKSILEENDSPLSDLDDQETLVWPRGQPTYTTVKNERFEWNGKYDKFGRKVSDERDFPLRVNLPNVPPIILPSLDLRLVHCALDIPNRLPDMTLLQWIKSNEVLPIIKTWFDAVCRKSEIRELMLQSFGLAAYPWKNSRDQTLLFATTKSFESFAMDHIAKTAKHAQTIVRNNGGWFDETFVKYELSDKDKYRLAISVLLTAWYDLETTGRTGFFGTLFKGPLAQHKNRLRRQVLDMWYILDESRIVRQPVRTEGIREGMTARGFMTMLTKHYVHSKDARHAQQLVAELQDELDQARAIEADLGKEIKDREALILKLQQHLSQITDVDGATDLESRHRENQATVSHR